MSFGRKTPLRPSGRPAAFLLPGRIANKGPGDAFRREKSGFSVAETEKKQ
jgi:hypothetical protein